ncbi:MAG: FadR/GntR family transcriptional regulator [Thalassobaculales bacterium]
MMTGEGTVALASGVDKPGGTDRPTMLHPLAAPRNLTKALIDRLTVDIVNGVLQPGERLPTEQQMVAALGVSRTVVREAVAALRAEGLVTTRQGVGAFVTAEAARRPFRLDPAALSSIGEVVNVLELRAGVECEASGLAASRASRSALAAIDRAMAAFSAKVAAGDSAAEEDRAFHLAIADASGNPQFRRFLEFLGRFMIPRQAVPSPEEDEAARRRYMAMIEAEHCAIRDAIGRRDAEAARAAMRQHLEKSRDRYRGLAARLAGAPAKDTGGSEEWKNGPSPPA